MPETSALSEAHFLLAACRAELIRAWNLSQAPGYKERKRRERTMAKIDEMLGANDGK